MDNYSAIVAQVLSEDFTSPVVVAEQEEQGKAQLTRAAAWEIYKQDSRVGMLRKTSGNNVGGLAVDVLLDRSDGSWVDVATATGVGNPTVTIKAHWLHNSGNGVPTGWVQPTLELALAPGPMPRADGSQNPNPEPEPPPPDNINVAILQALEDITATQAHQNVQLDKLQEQANRNTASIIAKDDYNTEKIQQQIHQVVEDAEKTLKEVVALYLVKNRPESPETSDQQKKK